MKRAFEFTDELTHAGTETPRGGRCRETGATAENVLARHLQGNPSRFGHSDGNHCLAEQGKPPQRVAESTGVLFGAVSRTVSWSGWSHPNMSAILRTCQLEAA